MCLGHRVLLYKAKYSTRTPTDIYLYIERECQDIAGEGAILYKIANQCYNVKVYCIYSKRPPNF